MQLLVIAKKILEKEQQSTDGGPKITKWSTVKLGFTHWTVFQSNNTRMPWQPGAWRIQRPKSPPGQGLHSLLEEKDRVAEMNLRLCFRCIGGGGCTFFTHEQPLAADTARVVEAVLHLTAVRPGASPPDGQQEDGLFWWLVHHVVEASSVLQKGFVEEPPVQWLRTRCCPAVKPQANHSVVLFYIIIRTYDHRAADWDCWRHCGWKKKW